MRRQTGFTLIEIAIVLVIIGLLLGGVLKGQELITSARVRNIISQQDGIKAAYFGFLDRFRALPGDYSQASTNIANVAAGANGNGNGQIRTIAAGDAIDEHIAAWDHLSKSGFINGSFTYAAAPETATSAATNPYVRYIRVIYDTAYGLGTGSIRHNIKTGNQIPSDIMAEIDRKIDDGNPVGGNFQFSTYDGGGTGGTAPTGGAAGQCYTGVLWSAATVVTNCGGASLL
ncbi:MAG TPA: prepilin-type N-terminal cleavage/methylation domain-containing protein [Burkholderiales bacterium]|nr:prepilin-type N-terminal cleavage/methylation domain-containing protein [Burkholderiales bacterium]